MVLLSSQQQHIIQLADTLAERFAGRADEYDRTGSFPFENYTDLHESGYLRLIVPPEYGGISLPRTFVSVHDVV